MMTLLLDTGEKFQAPTRKELVRQLADAAWMADNPKRDYTEQACERVGQLLDHPVEPTADGLLDAMVEAEMATIYLDD
jgi:hypothetical protein